MRSAWVLLAAGAMLSAQAAERLPDRRAVSAPVVTSTTVPMGGAGRETTLELLNQLEQLRLQVEQLQNQVEMESHELGKLRAAQRDLASDLDRRVSELERRASHGGETAAARPAPGGDPVRSVDASEQQQYDAAFALLKQGQYERADKEFRAFLVRYPESPLAGNANYWIGKANNLLRNQKVALDAFTRVVNAHGSSDKVPDALLEIGYIHAESGAQDKARAVLQDVIRRYPQSNAARNAEKRLEKMGKGAR